MKKSKLLFYFLLIPLFSLTFQSCSDDEESYEEWRKENDAYINKIKEDGYLVATIPGGPGPVYYEIINGAESGIGTYPIYTSKVKVRYKGSLINDTVFDDASERTVDFNVNELTKGFAVALQNMQVGEKWKIYVPWDLGYGSSGRGSIILPYSALIFELELLEISQI